MLKAIQQILNCHLPHHRPIIFLGYQLFLYNYARILISSGNRPSPDLDVSGLSRQEATELLNERYLSPIVVYYREERTEISMDEIGFQIDTEGMLDQAAAAHRRARFLARFRRSSFKRAPGTRSSIDLQASHDRAALTERIQAIADFLDQPAKEPQLLAASTTFQAGEAGYVMNLDASLPAVEDALYRADDRVAHLVIDDQDAPQFSLESLRANLEGQLDAFSGVGSVFIMDLQTGEELGINADVAMSGLSILKILIFCRGVPGAGRPTKRLSPELV